MSDLGRKDFTEKTTETLTPDSHKTTTETVHDHVTGTVDHVVRDVEPHDHKSTTQTLADKAGHGKDEHHQGGTLEHVVDSAKHAVGMDKKEHEQY